MGQTGRFCTKCGERLEGRFRFCPVCGAPVPDAEENQADGEGKVTPISPEARRIISTFEAQIEAMKAERERREQSPMFMMKKIFDPKLRAVILGGSLIFFVSVCAAIVFLYTVLSKYLQAAMDLK